MTTSARRTQESDSVRVFTQLYSYTILTYQTGQVGKVLGERWKALNDKQRLPYENKAAEDKKRYEDEKASYNVCYTFISCCNANSLTVS